MSRESLKRHCEAMCKQYKAVPTSGTYGEHRLVLDLLEQTEWIPVSERLPKDEQKVLVTTRSGNLIAVDTSIFYHSSAFWEHYVIAWMPLPEPYRESEK